MCWSLIKFFSTCLALPSPGRAMLIPYQGSSVCPTLPGHSCYLSCRFRSFSLRPPASASLCRPWFRPASSPALHAGSASFSCPTSGGAVFHQGLQRFVSRSPRSIAGPFERTRFKQFRQPKFSQRPFKFNRSIQ